MSLASALTTAVLPILAIAVAGYLFGRRYTVDVEPLNTVTLYILVPALIFHSLATTTLAGATLLKIGAGVVAYVVVMTVLAEGVGRLAGETEPHLSAFVLVAVFPNSGNFGIPLSEFAFGATGRTTAVIYLTVQAVLAYTLGVYVASRGAGYAGYGALREVFRLPLVYAAVAAIAARSVGVLPPANSAAVETIKLVGDASIPLMLIILGIQLSDIDVGAVARVGLPSGMKLFVAPAVGLGVALALGFSNVTASRVFVLECATPAAITPLILAIEYAGADSNPDGELSAPEYISTTIFVTTLASVVVLTVLIGLLQSGILI
jgi:predicted permease